jgi:EEF1A lysine methyltransferase 2
MKMSPHPYITYKQTFIFQVFDITNDDISTLSGKYGLIHDKGTYDAISLNPETPKENRLKYIEQISTLVAEKGLYIKLQ